MFVWGLFKILGAKLRSPPSLPSIYSKAHWLYIYLIIILYLLPLISQKHIPNILYTYTHIYIYTIEMRIVMINRKEKQIF